MADILDKTWAALVTDVEKVVDADVKKPHIDDVVKFFMKDVGFAKPSVCNVSDQEKKNIHHHQLRGVWQFFV